MAIANDIQAAIKTDKAIIGYKKSIKSLKLNKPKIVVIADNIPENMKKEIEHNAKIAGIKVETFNGDSNELGVVCGKPFPVSALAIRG